MGLKAWGGGLLLAMLSAEAAWQCQLPSSMTPEELKSVQKINCDKVKNASASFDNMQWKVTPAQVQVWNDKKTVANDLCEQSNSYLGTSEVKAAELAVKAWSEGIMNSTVCCVLSNPPFCLDTQPAATSLAVFGLLGLVVTMFAAVVIDSWFFRAVKEEEPAEPIDPSAPRPHIDPPDLSRRGVMARTLAKIWGCAAAEKLLKQLENASLRQNAELELQRKRDLKLHAGENSFHSIGALPKAKELAESTSSLFGALHETFDFQADSVKCQYEHLLSIWRSHVANVADRMIQNGQEKPDESFLIVDAIADMHTELLQGFTKWKSKFVDAGKLTAVEGIHSMGGVGVGWKALEARSCRGGTDAEAMKVSRQLAEISAYLLVWGEGGNIRFMPEAIYFFTELVLSAKRPETGTMYDNSPNRWSDPASVPYRSANFLAKVIRPMYNVVFDENYDGPRMLKPEYKAYLPPDCSNYDDWNEMFLNPERLSVNLVLRNDKLLFDQEHDKLFQSLQQMDWGKSLNVPEPKTHREIHSAWGFLASTHRIWLLHELLFAIGVCIVAGNPSHVNFGHIPLLGSTAPTRFAAVGLLVPLHAVLWGFARYNTTGAAVFRSDIFNFGYFTGMLVRYLLWGAPLATYGYIRYLEWTGVQSGESKDVTIGAVLSVHAVLSAAGFVTHLGYANRDFDAIFEMTPAPVHLKAVRYCFWFFVLVVKFLMGLTIFYSMYDLMTNLNIVMLGHESFTEIEIAWSSTSWGKDVLQWIVLWFTTFFLFCTDTSLWFTLGCACLGVVTTFAQRSCEVCSFCFQDAMAKIPELFSEKVLVWAPSGEMLKIGGDSKCKSEFVLLWNRIVEYLRYEDKIDHELEDHAFKAKLDPHGGFTWKSVLAPLKRRTPSSSESELALPPLFNEKSIVQIFMQHYCSCCGIEDRYWTDNPEVQWRYIALSRGLGLDIPQPYRVPYIPGITVLIPQYSETIVMSKDELLEAKEGQVALMSWIKGRYPDEWKSFTSKMNSSHPGALEWDDICVWASMRMQTLWRTVAGLTLYYPALNCHMELQGVKNCTLGMLWDPSECFNCVVAMQVYTSFNDRKLQDTERMFRKFPAAMKVAYIDEKDKNEFAEFDRLHGEQKKRYFSGLIDRSCQMDGHRRKPRLEVELPGYTILGDGKGDNQNHAIIFTRGTFQQCIDANQGAYFEQMLLLPCVLGEFRTPERGDNHAKQIIGLPEHITSDFGSIGDFAAGAETAFGTILQRTYSVLGARMHYGHPDIMNKQFMMQQGGVSKATKTLNLSEDIFAGMDFTLRGDGRSIKHCEYFNLAKGRDLGFAAVIGFFSKLSSGTGEQILTRQMFRLLQLMPLPDALSFFYAHVGYYFTQALVASSMPILTFVWSVVLAGDCEVTWRSFENYCPTIPAAEAMARVLSVWYSWVLILFLLATSTPLFAELWMQRSLKNALCRLGKQFLSLSPLLFVFQSKLIGGYIVNELRYGGASYVDTGRGLPTERTPFIFMQTKTDKKFQWENGKQKWDGLYLGYAALAFYDGITLLGWSIVVLLLGGMSDISGNAAALKFTWISIGITILSWLYGPFLFNPYQFSLAPVKEDIANWMAFFWGNGGEHWVDWYRYTQLFKRGGFRDAVFGANFIVAVFCIALWFAMVNQKLQTLTSIYDTYSSVVKLKFFCLLPPVATAWLYCIVVSVGESLLGRPKVVTVPVDKMPDEAADEPAGIAASDAETETDTSGDSGEDDRRCKFPAVVPLPVSAMVVVGLQVLEAVSALLVMKGTGWWKTLVSGLVLQFLLCDFVLFIGEGVLRLKCYREHDYSNPKPSKQSQTHPAARSCISFWRQILQPLNLWVHANRMFRDMLTSGFIFATLSPLVLINWINESLCEAYSLHHALVYRDIGYLQEKKFADEGEESADEEVARGLIAGAGSVSGVTAPPMQTIGSAPRRLFRTAH